MFREIQVQIAANSCNASALEVDKRPLEARILRSQRSEEAQIGPNMTA